MIEDLELGKAGEHLVCADLILKGYKAYLSDQGLPYDVVCDIGTRLIKVQVKTTMKTVVRQIERTNPSYMFSLKWTGKHRTGNFNNSLVDVFALVCIEENAIGYILPSETKSTISIRSEKYRGCYTGENGKDGRKGIYIVDIPFQRVLTLLGDN